MKRPHRQRIRTRHQSGPVSYALLFLFTAVLLGLVIVISLQIRKSLTFVRPLRPLPVPVPSRIASPVPLILAKIPSTVLGFGTFDPFDIITAVNAERAKAGSKPLRANETLMRAAALRADAIMKNENFSHQDPYTHTELGTVLPRLNYHFIYASENIGMGGNSGKDFVDGFMHSTAHRINLLDPTLTDTGVAVVDGPYDRYYVNVVVQIFSIPGGKEEYLGYSDADRAFYETELASLNTELEPFTWFILNVTNSSIYSDQKKKTLNRQKEILETVITVMKKSEPLQTEHVALIREFNKNLAGI